MGLRRGFTLIEVMVCLVLLTVVLIPLGSGMLAGNLQSVGAQRSVTALYLAQAKMEKILNSPFAGINPEPLHNVDGYPGYSCQITVNGAAAGAAEGERPANGHGYLVKKITVTIYYRVGSIMKNTALAMEKTNRDDEADRLQQ